MTVVARRRLLADAALLGVAFIWGSTFVLVKNALESASTVLFLAARFSLAATVMALLYRRRAADPRASRPGLVVGGLLFLGYLFQTIGLRLTTPAKSGLITGLAVVVVPVLGAALFRTRVNWNCWAGVAISTLGLYLLAAPSGGLALSPGDLWTLACAAAFGLHLLLLGRYSRTCGVAALSLAQVAVAAALALASFWWIEEPFLKWTPGLLAALAVTGLLATALAFTVQTWAQQFTSPTHTALILTLEPVFAWLTSYVVLGETLGVRGAWGAVLILAGIVASNTGAPPQPNPAARRRGPPGRGGEAGG